MSTRRKGQPQKIVFGDWSFISGLCLERFASIATVTSTKSENKEPRRREIATNVGLPENAEFLEA